MSDDHHDAHMGALIIIIVLLVGGFFAPEACQQLWSPDSHIQEDW